MTYVRLVSLLDLLLKEGNKIGEIPSPAPVQKFEVSREDLLASPFWRVAVVGRDEEFWVAEAELSVARAREDRACVFRYGDRADFLRAIAAEAIRLVEDRELLRDLRFFAVTSLFLSERLRMAEMILRMTDQDLARLSGIRERRALMELRERAATFALNRWSERWRSVAEVFDAMRVSPDHAVFFTRTVAEPERAF